MDPEVPPGSPGAMPPTRHGARAGASGRRPSQSGIGRHVAQAMDRSFTEHAELGPLGTPAAFHALRADGLRIVMLTGDAPATAQSVARELGISELIAGALPDQKAHEVARLQ